MNPHSTHACVFACLLSSSAMLPTTVAAEPNQEIQQGIYTVSIKSGSLAQAIADIGQQTDTNIVVSQDLIADKVVSAMTKTASINAILETLLLDTGLVYAEAAEGVYLVAKPLTKTKEKTDAEFIANTDVEIIRVRSQIVDTLISNNTSFGTLGTREIVNTPFSVNAFGADFIRNVNALSISEIASRDPSVSREQGIAGWGEPFSIRGLGVDRFGVLYDGIPGLIGSDGQIRVNNAQRIEVFRGINAFNSGASTSVFGGVGGTVNIAVKRPGPIDLSNVFIGYQENGSLFYGADFSRRAGEDDQVGFRFNAFSQPELSNIDGFNREVALFSLFADWQINNQLSIEGEVSRNVDESISARHPLGLANGLS
ncbi:MAG: TonB-dependent receptor, partial [Pseudomonadota bacterium]